MRGIALILTIGVLALLSLVAVTLASNMLLAKKGARNYLNNLKAKYLVEAGVAKAIVELKYGAEGPLSNGIDTASEAWNSGYSDSTLLSGLGGYSVSIVDCAGKIYLNDGNPRLAQILKNLNTVLGSPLTDADCDNIAANAPYATEEMVKTAPGITEAKYNAIKNYITVNCYVDPYTIDPQDVAPPNYGIQARAPVNINTASQQLIQAALTGLHADYACPTCGGDGWISAPWAFNYACPSCSAVGGFNGLLDISSTEAQNLAAYIMSNRPYSSWGQFYNSIKTSGIITPKDEDLILANANPNTGFSPARNIGWSSALGSVSKCLIDIGTAGPYFDDKGLTINTTEFSFNSGGYYEIESTGTLRDSSGSTVAQKKIRTIVKIFNIFRQTTQAQFEGGTKTNVQTYPEAVDAGVSAAAYDGQVMLATKQSTSPNSGAHFRANYVANVIPDSSGGNPNLMVNSTIPTVSSVAEAPSNRGDLWPDGLLATDLVGDLSLPFHYALSNISADAGTLEIWFKPMWNSNDTAMYSYLNINRKMFRITSGDNITGYTGTTGVPFVTFFFWSDWNMLYAGCIGGGGEFQPATGTWSFWGPVWWEFNGGGWGSWTAGKWNQLVFTWRNPPFPEGDPPGSYNDGNNPYVLYFNGVRKTPWSSPMAHYSYHTPYADTDESRAMVLGGEYGTWNGSAREMAESIIGQVRTWSSERTGAEVLADYNDGMYLSNGTFVSSTFNPGSKVEWGTVTWTEAAPAGGDITMDVDTGGGVFSGNWSDPVNGQPVNAKTNSIKYRAAFSTSAAPPIDTPVLEDVTITYLPRTQLLYWRGY